MKGEKKRSLKKAKNTIPECTSLIYAAYFTFFALRNMMSKLTKLSTFFLFQLPFFSRRKTFRSNEIFIQCPTQFFFTYFFFRWQSPPPTLCTPAQKSWMKISLVRGCEAAGCEAQWLYEETGRRCRDEACWRFFSIREMVQVASSDESRAGQKKLMENGDNRLRFLRPRKVRFLLALPLFPRRIS